MPKKKTKKAAPAAKPAVKRWYELVAVTEATVTARVEASSEAEALRLAGDLPFTTWDFFNTRPDMPITNIYAEPEDF